jgi:hypothetical protein
MTAESSGLNKAATWTAPPSADSSESNAPSTVIILVIIPMNMVR